MKAKSILLSTCSMALAASIGLFNPAHGQFGPIVVDPYEPSIWPDFPGLSPGDPLTLVSMESFLSVATAAGISYFLAGNDSTDETYYYLRSSLTQGDDKFVLASTYGVERKLAPWFAMGVAGVAHVWEDTSPSTSESYQLSAGLGATAHMRWYAYAERQISPYLEYGAGLFYGFEPFPANGTNFTFNLSTNVGVEFELPSDALLRVGYGNSHQSNNGYLEPNPGFDGNSISITYAWKF